MSSAFNCDLCVQHDVNRIIQCLNIKYAVETGTSTAATTRWLSNQVNKVWTIEIVEQQYNSNVSALSQSLDNVTFVLGSSDEQLPLVIDQVKNDQDYCDADNILFYLDAHWYDHWPLRSELDGIATRFGKKAVIVIDDFKVPNRNKAFDVYGKDECCIEYILDKLSPIYPDGFIFYYSDKHISSNQASSTNGGLNDVGKIYIFDKCYMEQIKPFVKFENGIPYSNVNIAKPDSNWLLDIAKYEKRIHSQWTQDGVFEHLFNKIHCMPPKPFCVEFGFNSQSLIGGSGANVANLVLNKQWKSLLLDVDYENPAINLFKHQLTSDNICDVFKQYNVPRAPALVSIDVDSTDLWLMKAILTRYRPYVISVEYNAQFPNDRAISFRNTKTEAPGNSNRVYGASLKALNIVAESSGYSLVYVVTGLDAIFLRNDLIDGARFHQFPHSDLYAAGKNTSINWHEPQVHHASLVNKFLDYEVWLQSQNEKLAVAAARDIVIERIFRVIPVHAGCQYPGECRYTGPLIHSFPEAK
jgi:hypothetical protein